MILTGMRSVRRNAQTVRACVRASLSPVRAHSGHVFSPIDHRTIAGATAVRACASACVQCKNLFTHNARATMREPVHRCCCCCCTDDGAVCCRVRPCIAVRIDVIIQNYIVDVRARARSRSQTPGQDGHRDVACCGSRGKTQCVQLLSRLNVVHVGFLWT